MFKNAPVTRIIPGPCIKADIPLKKPFIKAFPSSSLKEEFKNSVNLVAKEVKSLITGPNVSCPSFSARLVVPTTKALI